MSPGHTAFIVHRKYLMASALLLQFFRQPRLQHNHDVLESLPFIELTLLGFSQ
jgi:hypothetical protein